MEGQGASDLEVVEVQDVSENSFNLKVTKTNLMNGNEGVVEVFNDGDFKGCKIDVKDKDISLSNKRKAYRRQWVQNYQHHRVELILNQKNVENSSSTS
jgi:ribosomal protein L23